MAISIADYIRQAALARGIDPNVALKVANGEGGLADPFRRAVGPAPSSQAAGLGSTENSYGPFQLYISGNGAGLGDKALAAGIDPRKNWQAGIDFALDQAKNGGWGPWYGAKAAGITGMMGIGNTADPTGPSDHYSGNMYSAPGAVNTPPSPPSPFAPTNVAGSSDGNLGLTGQQGSDIASILAQNDPNSPHNRRMAAFQKLAQTPNAPAPRMGGGGDARSSGNDLLKALQANGLNLSQLLLKQRLG